MTARKSLIPVALLLACTAASWWTAASAGEKKHAPQLQAALVVVSGGSNPVKAYRVQDAAKLASLEGMFPGYRQKPRSNRAGAWEVGYEVFFMFDDRSIVPVMVSPDGEDMAWSTGEGDLAVKGSLRGFLAGLDGK